VIRRSRAGENENAGADDGANAERNQVGRPECAPKAVFPGFLGFLEDFVKRFPGQQICHGL